MLDYMYAHLWALLAFMLALHLADYYLTIAGARRYKLQSHLRMEGSYELNPAIEKDINKLRAVSPKFLSRVGLALILYAGIWFIMHGHFGQRPIEAALRRVGFDLLFGMVMGVLLVVLARHLQNYRLFGRLQQPGFAEGTLSYARPSIYIVSADMLAIQCALALTFGLLTQQPFFGGMGLMCWAMARRNRKQTVRLAEHGELVQAAAESGQPAPAPLPAPRVNWRALIVICTLLGLCLAALSWLGNHNGQF